MRKSVLAAAVCATTAGLAGCSAATDLERGSAREVHGKALEAMRRIDSLRLTGTVTTGGGRTELDVSLAADGRCAGSLRTDGGTAEISAADGRSYLRGDEAFWRNHGGPQGRTDAGPVAGRWVELGMPAGDDRFGGFCELERLLEDLAGDGAGVLRKGEPADVGGRETIPLVAREEGETTTVYVANDDDRPYLVRVRKEGGDESGVMDLTDHGKPADITEPDPEDIAGREEPGQPPFS